MVCICKLLCLTTIKPPVGKAWVRLDSVQALCAMIVMKRVSKVTPFEYLSPLLFSFFKEFQETRHVHKLERSIGQEKDSFISLYKIAIFHAVYLVH